MRDAQPDDAGAVAGVHVRSWQVAYSGLLSDEYLDRLDADERRVAYRFGDPRPGRPATIVAVDDGAIRGFATMGPARDPEPAGRSTAGTGELYAIYVDPPWWGTGVGRALIAEARARLSRYHFAQAVLWVLIGNDRAQRFYEADGWRPDGGRREETVWGVPVDEARHRRQLP